MNNKTNALFLSLALTLLAGIALADNHNVLKDASFEEGLAPEDGGWTVFEKSWVADDHAHTGSRSMFNSALSRTVPYQPFFVGEVSGSFQEFPATAGSRWQLTGYGMTVNALEGAPAFGIVQISFFNEDGEDIGTVETAKTDGPKAKLSNEVNSKTPAGEWVFLDTGVATAPEGTATVQAFTLYVDFSGSDIGQGVHFDDLTLRTVADDE